MIESESDPNCILNGTKYKLIVAEILNEPKFSTSISEEQSIDEQFLNDENDKLLVSAFEWEEFKIKMKKGEFPAKRVRRNRQLAIIRRKDCQDQFTFKTKLEDIFWPVDKWPGYIIDIMLSDGFNYHDRLSFAAFFHGNGLHRFDIAVDTFKFYNKFWKMTKEWDGRFYEFTKLWEYLDKAFHPHSTEYHRIRSTYYYYSLMENHMLYYDGSKRIMGGMKQPFTTNPYN